MLHKPIKFINDPDPPPPNHIASTSTLSPLIFIARVEEEEATPCVDN